jgi:hypothetical protein
MTNREKYIFEKLRDKARNERPQCYNPGCANLAIRSHIQQVEGPLRAIAENGMVVQLEDQRLFSESKYDFKEKGITDSKGDVLTFWGFCNDCDQKIFNPIETPNSDLFDYKNQLLHSYRGFLNEMYKIECNLKLYNLLREHPEISNATNEAYTSNRNFAIINLAQLRYFKQLYEQDIVTYGRHFEFTTLSLPPFEVCTSAIFCFPFAITITEEELWEYERGKIGEPTSSFISISLVPASDNLMVIVGQPLGSYSDGVNMKFLRTSALEGKLKFVSDILISRIETWCVSVGLYNKWKKNSRDKLILENIHKHWPLAMKEQLIDVNIFEI